ncbi:hypothetical protein J6590_103934 [Homalodisca vitripennis]|nr:hypothetical protein J6590_103934 [Homalodisca vitripennis]
MCCVIMPSNVPAINNIVSRIPIKGIIVLLVVSIMIFVANWYVDQELPWVPYEERCSSAYPKFGVLLNRPQFLEDGSVQSEDEIIYSSGAFRKDRGMVFGCPCTTRFCITRCSCVNSIKDKCENTTYVSTHSHIVRAVNSTFNNYNLKGDSVCPCSETINTSDSTSCVSEFEELYILNNVTDLKTFYKFYLLDDLILDTLQNKTLDRSEHCLEQTSNGTLIVMSIPKEVEDGGPNDIKKGPRHLIQALMMISILINSVTFVVFALLPRLRSGYGYGLMCYVASRCVKTLATQIYYAEWFNDFYFPCVILAATIQFLETASRGWQVIVSYQMWAAFRPGTRGSEGNQKHESHILHNCLAWGIPLGLALATVLVDLIPWVPNSLRPLYGHPTCWYNNLISLYIFFVLPVAVGEQVNLVRCLCTLWYLGQHQRECRDLQGNDNRCHNVREIRW